MLQFVDVVCVGAAAAAAAATDEVVDVDDDDTWLICDNWDASINFLEDR